jgi:hypothetical protein
VIYFDVPLAPGARFRTENFPTSSSIGYSPGRAFFMPLQISCDARYEPLGYVAGNTALVGIEMLGGHPEALRAPDGQTVLMREVNEDWIVPYPPPFRALGSLTLIGYRADTQWPGGPSGRAFIPGISLVSPKDLNNIWCYALPGGEPSVLGYWRADGTIYRTWDFTENIGGTIITTERSEDIGHGVWLRTW